MYKRQQFARPTTVDELRRHAVDADSAAPAVVLAATDPANPYGAALDWPETSAEDSGHRPGRKAGALVVLLAGEPVLFVERGGKTVLTFSSDADRLRTAAGALADAVRAGRLSRLRIDQVDSRPVLGSEMAPVFVDAGFATTPRGVRLRYGLHA